MKIPGSSIQGISHAYYQQNGKNQLKSTVQLARDLNREAVKKAVEITISKEALELANGVEQEGK